MDISNGRATMMHDSNLFVYIEFEEWESLIWVRSRSLTNFGKSEKKMVKMVNFQFRAVMMHEFCFHFCAIVLPIYIVLSITWVVRHEKLWIFFQYEWQASRSQEAILANKINHWANEQINIFRFWKIKKNELLTFNAQLLYKIESMLINVSHCTLCERTEIEMRELWIAFNLSIQWLDIFSINVNNFTASIAWPIGKLIYNRNEMTAYDFKLWMVSWFTDSADATWIENYIDHLDFLFDSFLFYSM